ncbi:MAG: ribosome maturation factor RimM [Peptococcaceae bacterium]|nr:ribosome maturation factor RimM [Peptococcaceae bacterium]
MDQPYVLVGQVTKPQGIGGEIKVFPLTDDVNRFACLSEIVLMQGERVEPHQVAYVRIERGYAYLKLEGVDSRDMADRYRGFEVRIDRGAVPPLTDRWYYFELEGMQVYEKDVLLGTLVRILETGANDVYVVRGEFGEICVPALKSVVMKVDVEGQRMDVVLPAGLLGN